MKNIEETVKTILATQLGCDADDLTGDTKLRADLGCDSLDEVEIVMALEDEFGTEISDEEAEKVLNGPGADATLNALIELVSSKARQA